MEDANKSEDEYFDTKSNISIESEETGKNKEESDEEEFFDALGTQEEELPVKKTENETAPSEMNDTAYLDSDFGQLPPKSIIKISLLFAKPVCPQKRIQSKYFVNNTKTES